MSKKGSNKKSANAKAGSRASVSLREELYGKKQTAVNPNSMLKLEHIKNLAIWATGEASIPSLGAFFGRSLAACAESLDRPPDPSLFPCQRCESILQPGFNCTVRIEKKPTKQRRRCKKPRDSTKNTVVYNCHFCSHRNLRRGTSRGRMKELYPQKVKTPSKSKPAAIKMDKAALPQIARDDPDMNRPATPTITTLLESKKRKRNRSKPKKADEPGSSSAVTDAGKTLSVSRSKQRRKSWTSLKEIAERRTRNITIPFLI